MIPGWAVALLAAGATAVPLTVWLGYQQQSERHIVGVRQATIWKVSAPSEPRQPPAVAVDHTEAARLARRLNRLPHQPSDAHCAADLGIRYHVRFQVAGGRTLEAVLTDGGCLGVDVLENGGYWSWQRWDPTGSARAEIAADLRRSD